MTNLKPTAIESLCLNPFTSLDKGWALLTAGDAQNRWNTMTVSWGAMGVIWNKYTVTTYVRPQRYTMELAEKSAYFTLSFFPENYRSALSYCGSKSGRDVDKAKETGLTPVVTETGVYFEEASRVIVCRKLYGQFLTPECFIIPELERNYAAQDYHKMYIGEILNLLEK